MSRTDDLRARMKTPADPATRAAFDQQRQAISTMSTALPHAGLRVQSAKLDAVVQERFFTFMGAEPVEPGNDRGMVPDSWAPGTSYLIWDDGRAVAIEPHPDMITGTAKASAPRLAATACDSCDGVGCAGVALVATPPHVVALVLCGPCASYVNPDPFLTPDQGDDR